MGWRGFYAAQKYYLNYPRCGRWYFYSKLPYAFIWHHWLNIRDRVKPILKDIISIIGGLLTLIVESLNEKKM